MKQQNHLKRSLGFFSAISIVIGTIIGSGIFFKQASVLQSAHNSTLAISACIFGGVITLAAGLWPCNYCSRRWFYRYSYRQFL